MVGMVTTTGGSYMSPFYIILSPFWCLIPWRITMFFHSNISNIPFIAEFPIQTYIYRRFSCSSWISHPQIPPNFPKPKLDRFDVTWLGFVGAETMASKATMDGEADTAHWTWESSGWICIWDIWLYIHHYKYIYTVYHIIYIYIYYKWLRMIVSLGLCLAKFDKD